jgi:hypothetical protein
LQYDQPVLNDLVSLARQQATRIALLEDELRRGSTQAQIAGQKHGEKPPPLSNLALDQDQNGTGQSLMNPAYASFRDKKPILFQGRSFATEYFGPSNPFSVVSTTPSILKSVCIFPP